MIMLSLEKHVYEIAAKIQRDYKRNFKTIKL
jgi:hypothetical protein